MNVNAWNRAVEAEMRKVGGVLLRANNHKVYRLPDGRRVIAACSPGDSRDPQSSTGYPPKSAQNEPCKSLKIQDLRGCRIKLKKDRRFS